MAKLLDATNNTLTTRKNTDTYTIDTVLKAARDVATAAGKQADGTPTAPLIVTRTNAESVPDAQNLLTQAIIGAKEGITEGITALVGLDITDAVLRSDYGTNFKGINNYSYLWTCT